MLWAVDVPNDCAVACLGESPVDGVVPLGPDVYVGTLSEVWERILDAKGRVWIDVIGNSMLPTLVDGESVLVERAARPHEVGRIAVIAVPPRLVVHRVVDRCRGRLVTRGDNCDLCDEPVAPSRAFGVVRSVRHSFVRRARVAGSYARRGKFSRAARTLWYPLTQKTWPETTR